MTNKEAIDILNTMYGDWRTDEEREALEVAILSLEKDWISVNDKLPDECDCDWVLAQVQEDNGYLWIPQVMEYRRGMDDWFAEDVGWLKSHNGVFKVIAWMPLPEQVEVIKNDNRNKIKSN